MAQEKERPLQPVSHILQDLFDQGKSPIGDQFQRWKLWYKWPQVVGEAVASYTAPVGYFRGTLEIWVESATHLNELSFVHQEIKDKVNTFMGKPWIESVRFTLNRKGIPSVEQGDPKLKDFLKTKTEI